MWYIFLQQNKFNRNLMAKTCIPPLYAVYLPTTKLELPILWAKNNLKNKVFTDVKTTLIGRKSTTKNRGKGVVDGESEANANHVYKDNTISLCYMWLPWHKVTNTNLLPYRNMGTKTYSRFKSRNLLELDLNQQNMIKHTKTEPRMVCIFSLTP